MYKPTVEQANGLASELEPAAAAMADRNIARLVDVALSGKKPAFIEQAVEEEDVKSSAHLAAFFASAGMARGIAAGVEHTVAELKRRGWQEPAADDGATGPLVYCGTWRSGGGYKSGSVCHWSHSLWVCTANGTKEQPGPASQSWSQMVRSTQPLHKRVEQLEKKLA